MTTTLLIVAMNVLELALLAALYIRVRAATETINRTMASLLTHAGETIGEMMQHAHSMAAQEVPVPARTDSQRDSVALLTPVEHATHADQVMVRGAEKEITAELP